MSSIFFKNSDKSEYYSDGTNVIAGNKSLINDLLLIFCKAIEKGQNAQISRSCEGQQFTFLANIILDQQGEKLTPLCHLLPISRKIDFILKFENKIVANNEKFCSKVINQLGFITPIITSIKSEKKDGSSIINAFKSQVSDFYFYSADDKLVFMLAFEAKTVNVLIKEKILDQLSVTSLKILFTNLGELAVYDLLIGNNDRLFRLTTIEGTLFGDPSFNSGNVMLSITPSKENGEQITFFAIDNGSSPHLETNMSSPNSLYTKFREAFSNLATDNSFGPFANHILQGIAKQFKFGNLDAKDFLIQGISKGLEKLKKLDREQFILSLEQHARSALSKTTLKLINENLSQLKLGV